MSQIRSLKRDEVVLRFRIEVASRVKEIPSKNQ